MRQLTIAFSGLLLLGLLLEWWLLYYSGLDIPGQIPNTPIDIRGLLLILLLLTVLIVFIKKLVRLDNSLPILQLTFSGTIVCFVAEFIFQIIKILTENNSTLNDRLLSFGVGVVGMTIFGAALSFFVSYQIKTRRTVMLVIVILSFMTILVFLRTLFPST